ncbi:uncharacterized protein LOC134717734 [Mytilus trossulus]|uniref:uncharacterized protein LOC134717734 n=1 Tax=Mytilus trossulus TaxID=6551 RepID=UPI003007C922
MCSNSGCPDVTEETFYNCEWLYLFNTPTGNCCTKNEPTHICSYSATVTLNTTNLEKEYATALLKQFCPARRAVDALVKWRNKYGHPEEIFLPDAQYRIEKSSIDNEIMILASFSGKDAQTRQKLSELEDISLDPQLCEQYRNTLLEQIDGVTDLKEVVLKFQDSCSTHLKKQDGQLVNIDGKYVFNRNFTSKRCAKFEIKTVKYADYKVFMSQLETSWIRISECKEKNTQFKFKRSTKSDKDKQFFHIESVDRPRHYVTMGFLDIWVRAKFYDDVSSEDDATWDIRCLKTVDQKGNSLPKYLLVPKSSQSFLCVDRTNRLRGCSDHLDVSKMFIFSKVN